MEHRFLLEELNPYDTCPKCGNPIHNCFIYAHWKALFCLECSLCQCLFLVGYASKEQMELIKKNLKVQYIPMKVASEVTYIE